MKVKREDGQMVMGFFDTCKAVQEAVSYRVVDALGKDCRWRNGLEEWLGFFCRFNAPRVLASIFNTPGSSEGELCAMEAGIVIGGAS